MATLKILQRSNVCADGTAQVYLRVTINRKTHYHPLKIYWPAGMVDENQGIVLPRDLNDTSVHDYNLLIRKELSKANEVLVLLRLSGVALTLENFKKEFYRKGDRNCVLHYYEVRMMERYRSRQITFLTMKSHRVTLDLLRLWSGGYLPFQSLDHRTAEKFDLFLAKERKNSVNGRWSKHRNFKTYLNDAIKDGYAFIHPYNYFVAPQQKSKWTSLTETQLKKLIQTYDSGELPEFSQRILRRFLFGCFTGMRISDLINFSSAEVKEGWLFYAPVKGQTKYMKMVKVPLVKKALELLETERKMYGEQAFGLCAQYGNRELKKIGQELINTRLHNHMSRETFATLFIESGGSLDALKEYLGHTSLKTTEKYLHISRKRLEKQAEYIDQIGK